MSYGLMQSDMTDLSSDSVGSRGLFCRRSRLDCGKTSEASMFSRRAGRWFGEPLIAA